MTTRQITPPLMMAVTLADSKDTLRIEQDDTSLDSQLAIWIKAVTEEAEAAANRAFVNQGLRTTVDAFAPSILLRAPLVSVESIKYIDAAGQQQTLDPGSYVVITDVEPGCVVPAYGKVWPTTLARPGAVTVDYTAGAGPDDDSVPHAAKLYILARLAEQWDPAVKEFKETARSHFVSRLLDTLKVYQ